MTSTAEPAKRRLSGNNHVIAVDSAALTVAKMVLMMLLRLANHVPTLSPHNMAEAPPLKLFCAEQEGISKG